MHLNGHTFISVIVSQNLQLVCIYIARVVESEYIRLWIMYLILSWPTIGMF